MTVAGRPARRLTPILAVAVHTRRTRCGSTDINPLYSRRMHRDAYGPREYPWPDDEDRRAAAVIRRTVPESRPQPHRVGSGRPRSRATRVCADALRAPTANGPRSATGLTAALPSLAGCLAALSLPPARHLPMMAWVVGLRGCRSVIPVAGAVDRASVARRGHGSWRPPRQDPAPGRSPDPGRVPPRTEGHRPARRP